MSTKQCFRYCGLVLATGFATVFSLYSQVALAEAAAAGTDHKAFDGLGWPYNLIVALSAAFWAGGTAFFNATNTANDRRDAVLVGRLNDDPIIPEHRRLILCSDWLPAAVAIGCLLLGAIIAAILVPLFFVVANHYLALISLAGVFALLISGIPFIQSAREDFLEMKKALGETYTLKPCQCWMCQVLNSLDKGLAVLWKVPRVGGSIG